MIRLGVNIDHVATIRNARGEKHPYPYIAAKSAIKFGAIGRIGQMFGMMGNNPSINALTNANAMAAQQAAAGQANLAMKGAAQPMGSGMKNDMSQMVMDATNQLPHKQPLHTPPRPLPYYENQSQKQTQPFAVFQT